MGRNAGGWVWGVFVQLFVAVLALHHDGQEVKPLNEHATGVLIDSFLYGDRDGHPPKVHTRGVSKAAQRVPQAQVSPVSLPKANMQKIQELMHVAVSLDSSVAKQDGAAKATKRAGDGGGHSRWFSGEMTGTVA